MAMICPQCSQVFEQQEQICPKCSIQLLFFARMAPSLSVPATQSTEGQWQHTGIGRVIVALILAQGLALGLKQLLTAGFLASGEDTSAALAGTLVGLLLLHSFQAIGLLIGGALAGAGQERGALYGALAGLGSGVVFMILYHQATQVLPPMIHYGQPIAHVILGAMGGWIGMAIWRPTPPLAGPGDATSNSAPLPQLEMRWLHGPIAWARVVAGATLMACGAVWSHLIMTWMIDASQGALNLTTHFQAKLVSWEVAGLTMFVGACFAGATTWNGAKQGLCVAIGSAVLYGGFQLANPRTDLETMVGAVLCMLGLGLAGGWFGGQLFPPLALAHRRRRIVDV